MQLRKMTSYAIRIMSYLIKENRKMTSTELMEQVQITHGVVMKILNILKEEGIVESHRGTRGRGGYTLTRKGRSVSIYEVMKVIEGELELHPEIERDCYTEDRKILYEELEKLNDEFVWRLKNMQIAHFI